MSACSTFWPSPSQGHGLTSQGATDERLSQASGVGAASQAQEPGLERGARSAQLACPVCRPMF